jgi:hypothetical protein
MAVREALVVQVEGLAEDQEVVAAVVALVEVQGVAVIDDFALL